MVDLVRVRTAWTGLAQGGGLSTHYFTFVEATGGAGYVAGVQAFWMDLQASMVNEASWQVQGSPDIISDVDGSLIGSLPCASGPGTSGTSTAQNYSTATQGLLRLLTDDVVAGRRLRGRLFIPGPGVPSGGDTTAPATGYQVALATAGDGLVADSSSFGPWRVWSRKNGTSAVVTSTSAWNKFAVLRSRRD